MAPVSAPKKSSSQRKALFYEAKLMIMLIFIGFVERFGGSRFWCAFWGLATGGQLASAGFLAPAGLPEQTGWPKTRSRAPTPKALDETNENQHNHQFRLVKQRFARGPRFSGGAHGGHLVLKLILKSF